MSAGWQALLLSYGVRAAAPATVASLCATTLAGACHCSSWPLPDTQVMLIPCHMLVSPWLHCAAVGGSSPGGTCRRSTSACWRRHCLQDTCQQDMVQLRSCSVGTCYVQMLRSQQVISWPHIARQCASGRGNCLLQHPAVTACCTGWHALLVRSTAAAPSKGCVCVQTALHTGSSAASGRLTQTSARHPATAPAVDCHREPRPSNQLLFGCAVLVMCIKYAEVPDSPA